MQPTLTLSRSKVRKPWVDRLKDIQPRRDERKAVPRSSVLLLIPPLSVSNRENSAEKHNPNRRQQQHQHSPIKRPLTFLGSASCSRIAHRATLPEAGHGTKTKHCQQPKSTSFTTQDLHLDSISLLYTQAQDAIRIREEKEVHDHKTARHRDHQQPAHQRLFKLQMHEVAND
jgi:hypothetical protein